MGLVVEPPLPRDSKNLQGKWAEHLGIAQAISTATLERSESCRHAAAARLPSSSPTKIGPHYGGHYPEDSILQAIGDGESMQDWIFLLDRKSVV